jgi:hypothetical protein
MDEYLWFGDEFDLGGVLIDLCAHRRRTIGTEIFVFVPFGENQKKPLPDRRSDPALRAVKRGRFKLFKTGFPHALIIKETDLLDNEILKTAPPRICP